jgi:Tfp pilus assembly protein PilN
MLRTNLSTRPFYNERAVRAGIAAIVLLAIGLTAFNAVELWRLQRSNRELSQMVADSEREARDLRQRAQAIRQGIDRTRLEVVNIAAQEANALIDRRAFSWTDLLNHFQATLPADVRITAVQPQIDQAGRMLVAITAISRKNEDLDAFMDALEQSGVFRQVLSRQDAVEEDGTLRSVLQAYYGAASSADTDAVPPPATSDSGAGEPVARTPPAASTGGAP